MIEMTPCLDLRPSHWDIVCEILNKHVPDRKVLAFGSRATWTAKEYSDLDLAVLGDEPLLLNVKSALTEGFSESDLPFKVDIVEWARIDEAFRDKIRRDGVAVHASKSDSEACHQTITTIWREQEIKPNPVSIAKSIKHVETRWQSLSLGDCIVMNKSTYSPKESWSNVNYLDTGSITENRISKTQHLYLEKDKLPSRARRKVQSGNIVYSTVRPNQRHYGLLKHIPENFLASTGFAVFRGKSGIADTEFIYWFVTQKHITEELQTIAEHSTSAYPSIKPSDIERLKINLPSLAEQRAIAHILGTLDEKIEHNQCTNEMLEKLVQTLFKSWFVNFEPIRAKMEGRDTGLPKHIDDLFPDRLIDAEVGEIPEGWEIKPLDEIADFTNGLALQKFRPNNKEERLPVVKIAQLRSGLADSAEWATSNIPERSVINNGDIVFSWSGSLMVKIWCGNRAALNQHLFKVTSEKYPKWFVYSSVLSHLLEFQAIAKEKATTMGHIKRHHLSEALCVIPTQQIFDSLDNMFTLIFELNISSNLESQMLANLRDTLLPELMSGRIRLPI